MPNIDLKNKTINELEHRIDELKEELKPKRNVYDAEVLHKSFEDRLEAYSLKINGKKDPEVINFAKQDLEESLTPATLEATSGIDEILAWIFIIELAYVVVENERVNIESIHDEVNVGLRGLNIAMEFLFSAEEELGETRFFDAYEDLKKYIPQYKEANKGAGCLVLIIGFSALSSLFLYL